MIPKDEMVHHAEYEGTSDTTTIAKWYGGRTGCFIDGDKILHHPEDGKTPSFCPEKVNSYTCHFTDKKLALDEADFTGAMTPNLPRGSIRYAMAKTEEAKLARKSIAIAFDDIDANCNTCSKLERVQHHKRSDGFLHGKCDDVRRNANPYNKEGAETFMFHPDDCMNMPCYENRRTHST